MHLDARFCQESSSLCVALFRALFPYLFASFRHSETASSIEFVLFRFTATRSPTGLLPGPMVDSDAPTFPLHAVANTSVRGSISRKREEERRRMCWRLDWVEDLHQFQNGSARISKRRKEKRRSRKCSCRKSISNLLYLNWSYAARKCRI